MELELDDDDDEQLFISQPAPRSTPAAAQQRPAPPTPREPWGPPVPPPRHHQPPPVPQPWQQPPVPPVASPRVATQPSQAGVEPGRASSSSGRWLPGPAGALFSGSAGTQLPHDAGDAAATQRPREKFRRTPAWIALEEQSRRDDGSSTIEHDTLHKVLLRCSTELYSSARSQPVKVKPINVLLMRVSQAESTGTDLGVTVADETGEMEGTLHRGILNDHPGKVSVGAAIALREVGVLSMSAWSHHLIIHPDNVQDIVPATIGPRRVPTETEVMRTQQQQGERQYERRGDTEVVREVPGTTTNRGRPSSPARSEATDTGAPAIAQEVGQPLDDLQQMLANSAAKKAADEQMRQRVATDVDQMMDNGVRINPMMLRMFGPGNRRPEALAAETLQPSQPNPVSSAALGGSVADLEIDDDDF